MKAKDAKRERVDVKEYRERGEVREKLHLAYVVVVSVAVDASTVAAAASVVAVTAMLALVRS